MNDYYSFASDPFTKPFAVPFPSESFSSFPSSSFNSSSVGNIGTPIEDVFGPSGNFYDSSIKHSANSFSKGISKEAKDIIPNSISTVKNYPNFHPDTSTMSVVAGLGQFSHIIKRRENTSRLQDIFGSHQNFDKMESLESKILSGQVSDNRIQIKDYKQGIKLNDIQQEICEAFPDFIMTCVYKDNNYDVWKAVVNCLLCNGVRYVVAICSSALPIGTKKVLKHLNWVSFQTRYSDEDHEITKFNLFTGDVIKPTKGLLHDAIRKINESDKSVIYQCDTIPLKVEVLKVKEDEFFSDRGTVWSALNLFSTILIPS